MGLITAGKSITNRTLRSFGVQLVRTDTLDRLNAIGRSPRSRRQRRLRPKRLQ